MMDARRGPIGISEREIDFCSEWRVVRVNRNMDRQEITLDAVLTEETVALPPWKRGLDLGLILLVAPGLLLIGAAVALVVKAGFPGPIFFPQRPGGYKRRGIMLFKFLAIAGNAEAGTHPL